MEFKAYLFSLATDKRTGIGASAVKFPLFLLSLLYGLIVRSLAFLYRLNPFTSPVKVISVGNITLGGTGKTMMVEYIAGCLIGRGRKVAVLSRGYKKPARGRGEGAFAAFGDEAGMLQKKFPALKIFVDPDRVRSLRAAAGEGVEAAILDDGFQQWRVKKDLNIVCVDAAGFGNGCVLPRGILREPLSALRRGDVFLITNTALVPLSAVAGLTAMLKRLNPAALLVESNHEPQGLYRAATGERCDPAAPGKAVLVCGIGNPGSFFDCCRRAGIEARSRLEFPDHHAYDPADIARIASVAGSAGATAVVTTEKDEIRLPAAKLQQHGLELYVLKAVVRITAHEQEFADRLRAVCPA